MSDQNDPHLFNGRCPRDEAGPMFHQLPHQWNKGYKRWKDPSDKWPDSETPKPRTCNYCGGAHPEDVLILIKDHGWRVEPTTKNYKFYLNPGNGEGPVPPVKGYIQHWTAEELELLNAQLQKQYEERKKQG